MANCSCDRVTLTASNALRAVRMITKKTAVTGTATTATRTTETITQIHVSIAVWVVVGKKPVDGPVSAVYPGRYGLISPTAFAVRHETE